MKQETLFNKENGNKGPRLSKCYLCGVWDLEANLKPIEVPDGVTGYISKLACDKCLNLILGNQNGLN